MELEGSLPVTFSHSPDLMYDGTSQDNTYESLIAATPTVSLFLMKSPIPFPVKFKLSYSLPVAGWNTGGSNAVIFNAQAYLKF